MISNILNIVAQVIAVLTALVLAVERPGEGAQKKAEVIAAIKAALIAAPIPAWAKTIFTIDAVVGVIVDLLVATLNKTGWIKPAEAELAPSPAG